MDDTETPPSKFPTITPILLNLQIAIFRFLLGLIHGQDLGLFEPWTLDQLRKRKCWNRIRVASNRMGVKIRESSRERRDTLFLSWLGLFHSPNIYTALFYSSAWGRGGFKVTKKPIEGVRTGQRRPMTSWQ